MEFMFLDTATLCPENNQTKLQGQAVASCY